MVLGAPTVCKPLKNLEREDCHGRGWPNYSRKSRLFGQVDPTIFVNTKTYRESSPRTPFRAHVQSASSQVFGFGSSNREVFEASGGLPRIHSLQIEGPEGYGSAPALLRSARWARYHLPRSVISRWFRTSSPALNSDRMPLFGRLAIKPRDKSRLSSFSNVSDFLNRNGSPDASFSRWMSS